MSNDIKNKTLTMETNTIGVSFHCECFSCLSNLSTGDGVYGWA